MQLLRRRSAEPWCELVYRGVSLGFATSALYVAAVAMSAAEPMLPDDELLVANGSASYIQYKVS